MDHLNQQKPLQISKANIHITRTEREKGVNLQSMVDCIEEFNVLFTYRDIKSFEPLAHRFNIKVDRVSYLFYQICTYVYKTVALALIAKSQHTPDDAIFFTVSEALKGKLNVSATLVKELNDVIRLQIAGDEGFKGTP
ncbi:MAG: hypothetical protein ACMG57_00845 [Candidatus Dojkabacteria bacterium]